MSSTFISIEDLKFESFLVRNCCSRVPITLLTKLFGKLKKVVTMYKLIVALAIVATASSKSFSKGVPLVLHTRDVVTPAEI